jgi:hypothetical protein
MTYFHPSAIRVIAKFALFIETLCGPPNFTSDVTEGGTYDPSPILLDVDNVAIAQPRHSSSAKLLLEKRGPFVEQAICFGR